MSTGNPDFLEYPIRVELCFRNQEQRNKFMGGLSDGFGENVCELDWPWECAQTKSDGSVIGFDVQKKFAVDVFVDDSLTRS